MGLPGEQQQHEEMNCQSPPAAARPQEVGSEGVAAATVVKAPAEVRGQGHVEEQQLIREEVSRAMISTQRQQIL